MSSPTALDTAVKTVSVNIVLEVTLKVFTFLLKAVCLRYVSPDVLGLANIRLLLMQQSIVFLSREPFRRSCIGAITTPIKDIVNIVWFVPIIGLCYSILFYIIWCFVITQPDYQLYPGYRDSVFIYALSALLELLAEPCHVVTQLKRVVTPSVVIIGVSTLNNFIITAALLINESTDGLTAFTVGQFSYGCSYVALYYFYFLMNSTYLKMTFTDILPNYYDYVLNRPLFSTTKKFLSQSVIKQLLTEGEKFAMTLFGVMSYSEQGLYDVVHNLGSLCARIVFKPIEDGGYLYFSQSLNRNSDALQQDSSMVKECFRVVKLMLHFTFLISVIVLVFGFSYSRLFLMLYGGEALSSDIGVNLLRMYCFYLLFMAINGTTECFTVASMNNQQLENYTFLMVVFSAIFLLCSSFLSYYIGAVGLILANCVNMLCRCLFCLHFISNYFAATGLMPNFLSFCRSIAPEKVTLVLLLVFGSICAVSEQILCCKVTFFHSTFHFALGAIGFLLVVLSIVLFDNDFEYAILNRTPLLLQIKAKLLRFFG